MTDQTYAPKSNHDLTAKDMFQSLTGYDEIAVLKTFGEDISTLRHRPFMFLRTLVFVDYRRRGGAKDQQAHKAAMDLTMAELEDYFAEDPDEDEDDTDQGKDEQPSS